jgi:hypothetical protein
VVHLSLIADCAEQLDQQQTPIGCGKRYNGLQLAQKKGLQPGKLG